MIKWIYIYMVCILVAFSSCKYNSDSKRDKQDLQIFKFDVYSKDNNNLNDYLELVRVLPLETNDQCFIRQISDLYITSEELVIWDNKEDRVLTFDFNGNFKCQIGSKGMGPNEYNKIKYFNVTTKPTVYYIYDEYKHKVIGLNKDGELISQYKIPSYYSYFLVKKNGDLMLFKCNDNLENGKQEDHFCVLDKNSKMVYSALAGDEDYWLPLTTISQYPISEVNDQLISLIIPLNDTVYKYTDSHLEPRFIIGLGDFSLSNELKQKSIKQSKGDVTAFGRLIMKQDELTSIMWLENSNCFFNIRKNKEPGVHYLLHDKRSKINKVFHSRSQEILWCNFFYPAGIVKGNSKYDLVFLLTALQLKRLQHPAYQDEFLRYCEKYPSQGKMLKETLDQITDNDNPVLIFTKLK